MGVKSHMKDNKNRRMRCIIACAIITLFCLFIFFSLNPLFIVLGDERKFYSVSITELDLRENHLQKNEEEKLRAFKQLKSLNFRSNYSVKCLDFLYDLSLDELQFGPTGGYLAVVPGDKRVQFVTIEDFTPLCSQNELRELRIIGFTGDNVNFLNSMPNLSMLELTYSDLKDEQIEIIGTLPSLKNLELSGSSICSLEPLSKSKSIEVIILDNAKINDDSGLMPLLNIPSLREVCISKGVFSDIDLQELRNNGIEVVVIDQ